MRPVLLICGHDGVRFGRKLGGKEIEKQGATRLRQLAVCRKGFAGEGSLGDLTALREQGVAESDCVTRLAIRARALVRAHHGAYQALDE